LDGTGIAHPQYYIATTSSPADDRARVLKYGRMFFVFDRLGDVQTSGLGEEGLFYDGMRHLSELSLNLWNARPLLLSSTVATNNFLFTADLANLDVFSEGEMVIHRGTLHLVRSRFLWRDSFFEKLLFVNHGLEDLQVPIRIGFDADFADIFEVRGTVREKRGERLEEQISGNSVILSYEGLDRIVRQTCIRSDANGVRASQAGLEFEVVLRPKEPATIEFEVCCSSETGTDSIGYTEGLYSKYPRIDKNLVRQYHEGLIATTCCIGAYVPQTILNGSEEKAEHEFQWWLDLFGQDYFIELQRHNIKEQEKVNRILHQ